MNPVPLVGDGNAFRSTKTLAYIPGPDPVDPRSSRSLGLPENPNPGRLSERAAPLYWFITRSLLQTDFGGGRFSGQILFPWASGRGPRATEWELGLWGQRSWHLFPTACNSE